MRKPAIVACLSLLVGCGGLYAVTDLTEAENKYPITKAEPPQSVCTLIGEFDALRTECGNMRRKTQNQIGCIRRAITQAGGNYGVLDAQHPHGWYRGRVFRCPSDMPVPSTGGGEIPISDHS